MNRRRRPGAAPPDDDALWIALLYDRRSELDHLRARVRLTRRQLGLRAVVGRALTFPLRFTPLNDRPPPGHRREMRRVRRWYRRHGRPVSVVIPSYRDADELTDLVRSIRRTTRSRMVEIVVADDASGSAHVERIRAIPDITVVAAEMNRGFAANANRAILAADPSRDIVLLNSDMTARRHWLAALQYASRAGDDVGIVGAKLLYPTGRIQFGGTIRNVDAREYFDHRFRGKPSDWGPANVAGEVLAVCGACMYVRREVLDAIGMLDDGYPMGYEDVDWCLRAWQAGLSVRYYPLATLRHYESAIRGTEIGPREQASQRHFWRGWGEFLDARRVRAASGALCVIYVVADVGEVDDFGDVFAHASELHGRGHAVAVFAVGRVTEADAPGVAVRTFRDRDELLAALAPIAAIKIATGTRTASVVWRASVTEGVPVYLVRQRGTSLRAADGRPDDIACALCRPEFRYLAATAGLREQLHAIGVEATVVGSDEIDGLEAFLEDVATPRRTEPTSDVRPALHRAPR